MFEPPVITIFVRHSTDCPYKDDEAFRRCNCRKHLRWSQNGKQYRRSAKARSWSGAEAERRRIEDGFRSGGRTAPDEDGRPKTIKDCIASFVASKGSQKLTAPLVARYKRELERMESFLAMRGVLHPNQVTLDHLYAFRNAWDALYPSTLTQQKAQERLRGFLRYCHNAGHMDRIPQLSAIKVDEPPTMPLTDEEYKKLLAAIPEKFKDAKQAARVRALIQLMRHSGLAIRDASTLEKNQIIHDKKKDVYRIVTQRQKTGTHVSVPIPANIAKEVLAVLNGNPRYVFWTGHGQAETTAKYWQRQFRKLRKASGLSELHSHQLRDTFAVDLLSKGVPLEEVSKLLGHESIKTTEKSYAKWVPARQDRLDNLVMATWESQK